MSTTSRFLWIRALSMTTTEFLPGNGSILVKSSRMNVWKSGFVKEPSTIFAHIIPSKDKAGSNEYLSATFKKGVWVNIDWKIRHTPSPTDKKALPNSSLTRKCPCPSTDACSTVKWTFVYKYCLLGCIVVSIVDAKHGPFGLIPFKGFAGELSNWRFMCHITEGSTIGRYLFHCEPTSS